MQSIKSICFGFYIVIAVLVFLNSDVFAAVEMDQVVVEAGQLDDDKEAVKDRTAFVTVIKAEDFDQSSKTFSDVVSETVGLNVRRLGGDGSYSTASIRGSSASQVTILIDGIPLNRGKSGIVNLGNILPANVDRVEIYRGSAPMKFRASSIGGVINIVTKKNPGKTENRVSASYGSYDTYEAEVLRSERIKESSYLISCSLQGSKGDFEFTDDRGTLLNPNDDYEAKLKNNEHKAYELFGKINHSFSDDLAAIVSVSYFDKDTGVQGPSRNHRSSKSTSLETGRSIINSKFFRKNLFKTGSDADFSAWFIMDESRFKDPDGEIGLGNQDNHSKSMAFGIDSGFSLPFGIHYISFLGSVQSENFDSEDQGEKGVSQKRNIYQAGFEDEVSFLDDSLIIIPQFLYSYLHNDFGGNVSFQYGDVKDPGNDDFLTLKLGCELSLSDDFLLKANCGRYYRYPNFSELFGDEGSIVGTPGLSPEKGVNSDIGYSFIKRGISFAGINISLLSIEQAFFYNRVDDLILFFMNSQKTMKASNISSAKLYGLETVVDLRIYDHIEISGNHTWQEAENTSDMPHYKGKKLPGVPRYELALKTKVFNKFGSLFYEYNYMAENYSDKANTSIGFCKERAIHNAGIMVKPSSNISIAIEAENISDNRIEDLMGYALPGRSFSGTLSIKF